MSTARNLILGLFAATLAAACQSPSAPASPAPAPSPALATGQVAGARCGGLESSMNAPTNAVEPKSGRAFFLEYPCDLKPGEQVNLVLNLHGGGSSGSWQRLYFPAGDYAASHRLVIVTPTSEGSATIGGGNTQVRMWIESKDDQYLRDLTDLMITSFGAANIRSFWLVGHSQGGITSTRIACSDFFAGKVDGFASLAGGRVGMRIGGNPTCDYSHIFETGQLDTAGVAGLPDTSPLAERFGCGPKTRQPDVVDTVGGKVYDPRALGPNPPRAGWGGKPGPGTAEIYTFPGCKDGQVVADIIRQGKGHTEGLEPRITETILTMITSAPGGKIRRSAG